MFAMVNYYYCYCPVEIIEIIDDAWFLREKLMNYYRFLVDSRSRKSLTSGSTIEF